MKDRFIENTSYYIENCLNPNQKWNRRYSWKKRIDFIKYADVNWAAISDHIKSMDYRDFLATPYWKAIAAHTKYNAGYRCQVCNSGAYLATHHRNYNIHGREHAHINELIVLCDHCHQKFHGNEKKIIQSRSDKTPLGKPLIMVLGLIALLIAYFVWGKSIDWETSGKAVKPSSLNSHKYRCRKCRKFAGVVG